VSENTDDEFPWLSVVIVVGLGFYLFALGNDLSRIADALERAHPPAKSAPK